MLLKAAERKRSHVAIRLAIVSSFLMSSRALAQSATVERIPIGQASQIVAVTITPSAAHIAAIMRKGSRVVVNVDGVEGPTFDEILGEFGAPIVAFSKNELHYAYFGRRGDTWTLVRDGKEQETGPLSSGGMSRQQVGRLAFSPSGARLAYNRSVPNSNGGHYVVVVDGKPGPPSAVEPKIVFSPVGERFAYEIVAPGASRTTAVSIDGAPPTGPGRSPQFLATGKGLFIERDVLDRIGSVAGMEVIANGRALVGRGEAVKLWIPEVGERVIVTVKPGRLVPELPANAISIIDGGKAVARCAGVDTVVFSPNGAHWAALCQSPNYSRFVVLNGKPGRDYQGILNLRLLDNGTPVYAAVTQGASFAVEGDLESDAHQTGGMQGPILGPGGRVAFLAMSNSGVDREVMIDGKTMVYPRTQTLNALVMAPDGKRYAFLAGPAQQQSLWLDGVKVPNSVVMENPIWGEAIVFSPDSRIAATPASENMTTKRRGILIGDRFAPVGQVRGHTSFSPDSRHIYWMAVGAGGKIDLVVDGEPAISFAFGIPTVNTKQERPWAIQADGTLHTAGIENDILQFVKITPNAARSVESVFSARR